MLRTVTDPRQNNWEELLNEEELNIGHLIAQTLKSNQPSHFERASLEQYSYIDSPKDPYTGLMSANTKERGTIYSDGKIAYGKVLSLVGGDWVNYSITDYNYIVLIQHLPGAKKQGKHEYYQSICTKKFELKIFVQFLLGMQLG